MLPELDNDYILSQNLYREMKRLSEFVCQIKPHLKLIGSFSDHEETFETYSAYPAEKQKKIFSDFLDYSNLLTNAIKNVQQTGNSHSLLWGAIKALRLSFDNSLFSNLSDDDVVEIYRNDNIQIFRNLKFHDICSYRYPELFVHQWIHLFEREDEITQKIMQAAMCAFSGETSGYLDTTSIGMHKMMEVKSPEQLRMSMLLKGLYPLKNSEGHVSYIVAVSRVSLSETRKRVEYENVFAI